VIKPDYPRHLVNFSLVDQSGQTVSRQDLDGKIVVVNFVFTTCTAVCPYVNEQMAKVQQLTAGRSDVRLLSLTLDPVDDTAPVLEKYGRTFGQDTRRWSFLTGDESAIHELVGTSFLSRDTTGAFAFMPGNFANSQRIVLVDPKGHVVSYFDGLNQQAASAVVDQIDKMKGS
jgi:protein SCO1/2